MSAQFVDALLGYERFLQCRGEATREEINAYLESMDRSPIQLRTYGHYQKLIAHGFRSYIPINKFDVFQSLGKLQIAADRRRYQRRSVDIEVAVSRDLAKWISGRVIDISLVGFGIITSERFPAKPGSSVWVNIDGYKTIPTTLAWRRHEEDRTRLGLRATEFIANFQIDQQQEASRRLTGNFFILRDINDDIDWMYLVQILEWTTEVIEAVSVLIDALADLGQVDVALARPILERINFGSPGSAEIKIDFGVAEILKVIFDKLETFGLGRRRYKEETRKLEIENTGRQIENANRQIEVLRNAVNFGKEARSQDLSDTVIAALLKGPLREVLGITNLPDGLFDPNSFERGVLEERILPASAQLLHGDDPTYQVGTSVDGDEPLDE